MKQVLYLTRQGARACYREGEIVIEYGGRALDKFSSQIVRAIYVFGKVEISPNLVNLIFRNNIDCVFLTADGRFKGRMLNPNLRMMKLRRMQYGLLFDEPRLLSLARSVVMAKTGNQRALLMRCNRGRNEAVSKQCVKMRRMREQSAAAAGIEKLMGFEGICGKYYWEGYGYLFKRDLRFKQRQMNPPPDPVNAALSFGYTLLMNEITNICQIEGLDIFAGTLHAIEDRRASLALDLMEEFRPVIVDHTVLKMFNLKVLDIGDFNEIETGIKVYLNESGRAKMVYNFRERLKDQLSYRDFKDRTEAGKIIRHQIDLYKSFVKNEAVYSGYEWNE